MTTFAFDAIGTPWTLELPDLTESERLQVEGAVRARIDAFDAAYSRFRPDSLVTRMATAVGTYELPEDAEPMLALYKELYDATDGAFTPLIGRTISDAGYDAQYSLVAKEELSAPPAWERALEYDHPHLTVHEPALLDFGAAGKGYLIDLVSGVLRGQRITSFVVNAGGDIRVEGQAVQIALEHPEDPSQAIGIASVRDRSICASSGNRRAWGSYHHILDPVTLSSPTHLLSVWTVADTALLADALATALFLAPPEAFSQYRFEYLMLMPDYSVRMSPGFPVQLFHAPHV